MDINTITIQVLACMGILFGTLCLESIVLLALETPVVKSIIKKIRHWAWRNFNHKKDFVDKD